MRIFHFTESYQPYVSGVTISIATLRQALEQRGHEVWIFAPHYGSVNGHAERVVRFPSLPSTYPGFRVALPVAVPLKKIFQESPPDIIHSHSPYTLGRVAARWAGQKGVPLVFTLHTRFEHYTHYLRWFPSDWVRAGLERLLHDYISRSDCVVVPAEGFRGEVERKYPAKKIKVVPSAVRVPAVSSDRRVQIRRDLGISEADIVYLFVGRISKEKNVRSALELFQQLSESRSGVHLLVVGDGPERDRLMREFGPDRNRGKIHWIGGVPRETIFEYYAAADILIFTSLSETQGLVLYEALGMGLPVLALDSPAAREVIVNGHNGFVAKDVSELVHVALRLLDRPEERLTLARNASPSVAPRLNTEKFAEAIENVYASVL